MEKEQNKLNVKLIKHDKKKSTLGNNFLKA